MLAAAFAIASAQVASSVPSSLPVSTDDFLAPKFIIGLNKNSPDEAPRTGDNVIVSTSLSSIFNFDIPWSYYGYDCELVFFFPKSRRDGSLFRDYVYDGTVGLDRLAEAKRAQRTGYIKPAVEYRLGSIKLGSQDSFSFGTEKCDALQKVAYEMVDTGGADLTFVQSRKYIRVVGKLI
ncbi:MAG: hypothetical protein Q9204_003464 [Flavoplaca sp. TL-2023a]